MKTIGIILIVIILQGCYQPYYKDSEWYYFEEWDTKQDLVLDKNEFAAGVEKYKKVRKMQPKSDSTVFAVADDNHDNEVTAVEFYKWEVSL